MNFLTLIFFTMNPNFNFFFGGGGGLEQVNLFYKESLKKLMVVVAEGRG